MSDLFNFFDEDVDLYLTEDNMDDGPGSNNTNTNTNNTDASDADLAKDDPGASPDPDSNDNNNNNDQNKDSNTDSDNNDASTDNNNDDNSTDDDSGSDNNTDGEDGDGMSGDDDGDGSDDQGFGGEDDSMGGNGMESEEPDPNQKMKDLEDSIFNQLSAQQKKAKIKELKELFDIAYQKCASLIDLLNSSEKAQSQVKVCDFVVNSLTDLQKCIRDYLINIFDSKAYIQNMIEFNKYLSVLNTVSNVISELNGETDGNKKSKSSTRK